MDLLELGEFKRVFDKYLENFFDQATLESNIKEVLGYAVINGGKRLRPWLIYVLGQLLGNNDHETLINLGMAVEILHTASLIHDDLPALDNATLRRGSLTSHLKFGEFKAVVSGDYGFVLPLKIINNLKYIDVNNKTLLSEYFIEDTLKLFEGEMLDLVFEKEELHVNEKDIIDMYSKKTGALFGLCFSIPFILKKNTFNIEEIHNTGIYFGIAFQIYDDLKDLSKNSEELGKDVQKDNYKKTLLNIYSLQETKKMADNYYESTLNYFRKINLNKMVELLLNIRNLIESR
ncbi:polyprenyl synthetase family protein [Petrotoga sp. 9PWA.NaAc.5.4]|uniref:polyprenyl synthetase family protein n=1 Tax=Petrotoga sp. 9PWA.NaAc.5.4 TaxID=1434328 RepID=UPI000CACBD0B|nr:polyprenyl synthetase family protein [Petrotoga sp. 9PWA.NaAc.5.4]PNR92451.1 geranyltranstransferase [Petrotoga sp. 9PWA.NaAc.5.4]